MITRQEILHIDDDPEFTLLLAEHLKGYGYSTTQVNDPNEVIPHLPRYEERLVLLDIDMPKTDGLALLKQIKTYDGGIQVIILTEMATMTSVLQSLRWGAEACFFKPISNIEPLVGAIDDAFRKIDRWWNTLEELTGNRKNRSNENSAGALVN
jgi:DNA-binding NtrC family response regulator